MATMKVTHSAKVTVNPYGTPVAELKSLLASVPDNAKLVLISHYKGDPHAREQDSTTFAFEWTDE